VPTNESGFHVPRRETQGAAPRPSGRARRWRRVVIAVVVASLSFSAGAAVGAEAADAAFKKGAKAVRQAGSTVKGLQRALGVTVDGVYGKQTRRAVRRFQRKHGLTVVGIAGPQTLGGLGVGARESQERPKRGRVADILERIASCESGGNPSAVSSNRRYFGKYQFSKPTWRSVGGEGNPARASEREQDRRARKLYRRAGTSPWPHCGAGL
jgi:hypothetical protein